jgi:hypothetical protein
MVCSSKSLTGLSPVMPGMVCQTRAYVTKLEYFFYFVNFAGDMVDSLFRATARVAPTIYDAGAKVIERVGDCPMVVVEKVVAIRYAMRDDNGQQKRSNARGWFR